MERMLLGSDFASEHRAADARDRIIRQLEEDSFLDRCLDFLEARNGGPLNLARWDLKAAIRESLR